MEADVGVGFEQQDDPAQRTPPGDVLDGHQLATADVRHAPTHHLQLRRAGLLRSRIAGTGLICVLDHRLSAGSSRAQARSDDEDVKDQLECQKTKAEGARPLRQNDRSGNEHGHVGPRGHGLHEARRHRAHGCGQSS